MKTKPPRAPSPARNVDPPEEVFQQGLADHPSELPLSTRQRWQIVFGIVVMLAVILGLIYLPMWLFVSAS